MDQELTTNREAENIINEARDDASFQKMLKFKKGDWWCDGEEVPRGTVYLAHCKAWTKTWVHFELSKVVERKVYHVNRGDKPPERDRLPNNDPEAWPKDAAGKPQDPWALQYLLPLENPETGDVHIFVTQSFGGRRAVSDLCTQWARRVIKNPKAGQPIVKIEVSSFPSKNWGDVKSPTFEVIGWDDSMAGQVTKEVDVQTLKEELNDDIPF